MIKSKDISVVVQGAISKKYTKKVLKSIRHYLPNAEIILSTWEKSDVKGLDYDVLVENIDPGAEILFPQWNQMHNLNRQIRSTKNGIAKASRPYLLKIRTDIKLTGIGFLKSFDKYPKRCKNLKLLNKRVVICENYVREPRIFPFHISDWVFFGLKEDVENIWNIPLAPEPLTTKYFEIHKLLKPHKDKRNPYHYFRHRYCAEQYIWYMFLKNNGVNLKFENMWDISFENILLSKLSFANNLIILSNEQYGIKFLKCKVEKQPDLFNFAKWEHLYKEYCDSEFRISFKTVLNDNEKYQNLKNRLRKHINNFVIPIRLFFKWLSEIFSIPYYFLRTLLQFNKLLNKPDEIAKNEKLFFENIINNFSNNIENINIVNFATGESYVLATQYDIENSKNTVWCTTNKSTYQIFQMFQPNKLYYIQNIKRMYFKKSNYQYKGKNIHILFGDDFWFDFWETPTHYLHAISLILNNKVDRKINTVPQIEEENRVSFEKKVQKMNLNLSNFVIISPEANSTGLLSKNFWEQIVNYLNARGVDVFCNVIDPKNTINNTKSMFLNYQECCLLASKSKGIIGLRSGFLELLCTLNIPMYVIYNLYEHPQTNFLKNLYENYTMYKYPNVSKKLKEYKCNHIKYLPKIAESIIKDISEDLKLD